MFYATAAGKISIEGNGRENDYSGLRCLFVCVSELVKRAISLISDATNIFDVLNSARDFSRKNKIRERERE